MDELARIPDSVGYPEAVVAYLAAVALKGVDMLAFRSRSNTRTPENIVRGTAAGLAELRRLLAGNA